MPLSNSRSSLYDASPQKNNRSSLFNASPQKNSRSSLFDASHQKAANFSTNIKVGWLKSRNWIDTAEPGPPNCISAKSEFMTWPSKLNACLSLQEEVSAGIKAPTVDFEGASRRPGHGTVKGWEIIKAGMEKVLGRSILPARGAKFSGVSAVVHAATTENAGTIIYSSTSTLEPKSCLSDVNSHSKALDLKCTAGHGYINRQAVVDGARSEIESIAHRETMSMDQETTFSSTQLLDPASISKNRGSINHAESLKNKSPRFLLSHDNALAGALAGACVSLCLHPIDTVKTVIQAQSSGQRSVIKTLVKIISDRGFSGLYRGIGSNLASSAPISAIYTFTYESVKSALLPCLPNGYHALAHCTAGGCASIATSFVYTPSECIKQRMQVGNLYRNSWFALLGILKNGGLSVLYSGWEAVLWRNVPQSVIKFYTYEGLKQYALMGHPPGTRLNTWQTLAFGGLAGSTAALFTTPFDVIKTRLQTQVAGSMMQEKGVLQVFKQIAMSEGIGGLYRGLIPRLLIYLSQGALFFASYEFFKQLLAVEAKRMSLPSRQSQGLIGQSNVVESL